MKDKENKNKKNRSMEILSGPQNLNPTIYERTEERAIQESDYDNDVRDEIDRREIFDLIRSINDPEHPLTLEGCPRNISLFFKIRIYYLFQNSMLLI